MDVLQVGDWLPEDNLNGRDRLKLVFGFIVFLLVGAAIVVLAGATLYFVQDTLLYWGIGGASYHNHSNYQDNGTIRMWRDIFIAIFLAFILYNGFHSKVGKDGKLHRGWFFATIPMGEDAEYKIFLPALGHIIIVPWLIKFYGWIKFPGVLSVVEKKLERWTGKIDILIPSLDEKSKHRLIITYTAITDDRNAKAVLRALQELGFESARTVIEAQIIEAAERAFSKEEKETWIGKDKNFQARWKIIAALLDNSCEENKNATKEDKRVAKENEVAAEKMAQKPANAIRIAFLEQVVMIVSFAVSVKLEGDDSQVAQLPAIASFEAAARKIDWDSFRGMANEMVGDSKGRMSYNRAMELVLGKEGVFQLIKEEIDLKGGTIEDAALRKMALGKATGTTVRKKNRRKGANTDAEANVDATAASGKKKRHISGRRVADAGVDVDTDADGNGKSKGKKNP